MATERGIAELIINRVMGSERLRESSHFSERVASGEPILTTGRQMATYLPDRYLEMRSISRLDTTTAGRSRWLSEAEHFYRQARFMADWEDDCPYRGSFKTPYPTYNAMSNRQMRGYFTWRAQMRRGEPDDAAPAAFAFVYLYELICGIGVDEPAHGFELMRELWRSMREKIPKLDHQLPVWLLDYAAYHGLDPALVADLPAISHERSVGALTDATREAVPLMPPSRQRRQGLPPLGDALEGRLFDLLSALSSYRIGRSPLLSEHAGDLRHVACAVYLRLHEHHAKRGSDLIESAFGSVAELPYTMFSSAVFFDPAAHPDTVYAVGPYHRYECKDGLWSCAHLFSAAERSTEIGRALRETDRRLREALGHPHPLEPLDPVSKYLAKIIDEEVAARIAWMQAHEPVRIGLDLSQLSDIRRAAAETRESLLIDEEREEGPLPTVNPAAADEAQDEPELHPDEAATVAETGTAPNEAGAPDERADESREALDAPKPAVGSGLQLEDAAPETIEGKGSAPEPPIGTGALPAAHVAYLRALVAGDARAAMDARAEAGTTEDLLVDAINEELFDLLGDTVLEFGPEGPQLIEDYQEDIERIVNDDE